MDLASSCPVIHATKLSGVLPLCRGPQNSASGQKALWRDRLETQRELSELVLDGHALYDAQLQRLRAVVKADGADTGG